MRAAGTLGLMARPATTAADPSIWTGAGYLNLADPSPLEIDLGDIARALSHLCRYTGLCPIFYSVAEHSVHAAELARRDQHPVAVQRAVLMHDAAEAYLGDVSRPLKRLLPDYRRLESAMSDAVTTRFALRTDSDVARIVKQYDTEMLAHEKPVMCPGAGDWPGTPAALRTRRPADFGMRPAEARGAFLDRAAALGLH